ncbi:glycerate kinase [Puniceicoccaceae bacterium K14]|nr:glycerate kinase [Puniceicoccaceae bacterium K14]
MRALIAFDKFKDSLTAHETCQTAAETLASRHPDWVIETAPLADGGDGFCEVLTRQADGVFYETQVTGPQGEQTTAKIGIVSSKKIQERAAKLLNFDLSTDSIAVIEMAQSSGIALVPNEKRSPWKATTYGLGELINFATEKGAQACVVGLGGSATHDLALGALASLGYEFKDAGGNRIENIPYPKYWNQIQAIVPPKSQAEMQIRIACDVENPLLGSQGAAAIFGPQKGMLPADYQTLEDETARMAQLVLNSKGQDTSPLSSPGTGAAGGAAFGLMVGLSGKIVSGFTLVKDWIGLEQKLQTADLVITGEGRFDASSLQGKGPGSLVKEASTLGKKSYVFAGSLGEIDPKRIPLATLVAISPQEMELAEAIKQTKSNLVGALQSYL